MDLAESEALKVPTEPSGRAGEAGVLIGVHCGPEVSEDRLREELARVAGPGLLGVDAGPLGYVLLPAENDEDGLRLAGELSRRLSFPAWLAVTRRQTRLQEETREAREVAAIAVAAGRPPGLYRMTDLPVEYAVVRQPAVLHGLNELIAPIADRPVLRAAVVALAAADGNRSKAAVDIGVHHSTLDYRLRQIRESTGLDPTSARDLSVLSIALTARAVARGGILESAKIPAS
jgi:hypothetical protein